MEVVVPSSSLSCTTPAWNNLKDPVVVLAVVLAVVALPLLLAPLDDLENTASTTFACFDEDCCCCCALDEIFSAFGLIVVVAGRGCCGLDDDDDDLNILDAFADLALDDLPTNICGPPLALDDLLNNAPPPAGVGDTVVR